MGSRQSYRAAYLGHRHSSRPPHRTSLDPPGLHRQCISIQTLVYVLEIVHVHSHFWVESAWVYERETGEICRPAS
jgi:hypothetical protein